MDKAALSKIPILQVKAPNSFEDGTLEENLEKLAANQNLKLQAKEVAYNLTVEAFTPEQPLWETLWHLKKLRDFVWGMRDDVLTPRPMRNCAQWTNNEIARFVRTQQAVTHREAQDDCDSFATPEQETAWQEEEQKGRPSQDPTLEEQIAYRDRAAGDRFSRSGLGPEHLGLVSCLTSRDLDELRAARKVTLTSDYSAQLGSPTFRLHPECSNPSWMEQKASIGEILARNPNFKRCRFYEAQRYPAEQLTQGKRAREAQSSHLPPEV
jgi:hypothetical protein